MTVKPRSAILISEADNRNQNGCVLSRHSGMTLAGIQSAGFPDSGQNRAGMTGGVNVRWKDGHILVFFMTEDLALRC